MRLKNLIRFGMLSGALALSFSSPVFAVCGAGLGNFQGSCLPADFTFAAAQNPADLQGWFWGRCSAGAPTGADSKFNAAAAAGVDQGSVTACNGWWSATGGTPCPASTTTYRAVAGGWSVNGGFDGCPLDTAAGDCSGTTNANTDTVFVLANTGNATTNAAQIGVTAVRFNATDAYDIDNAYGTGTTSGCNGTNNCRETSNGGTFGACAGGTQNVFSFAPTINSSTSTTVTLAWTHPTIKVGSNAGATPAYPISSWSIYKIDSAAAPTNFALGSWTEVRRVPGNVNTATFAFGAAPVNRYYFALLPNFDGNGGLNAGAACSPGVDCAAFSTNTWTMGTAGVTNAKVMPASASFVRPTASAGTFVNTSAVYESLQKVTIGFTTTDETGVVGFNVYRGTGANPVTWTKVTTSPMAANGVASTYSFTDSALPRQRTYGVFTYKVEAIDAANQSQFEILITVQK